MASADWILTERVVDEFLQTLKLEHLRFMDENGSEKPTIQPDTLIDYETFCAAYEKMDKKFQSRCPKTFFAFSNNGLMQTRYDDLSDNFLRLVHTYDDYYELCYCGGEFNEHVDFSMFLKMIEQNYFSKYKALKNMTTREYNSWVKFANDHACFLLNPFNRKEVFVSEIIESELLIQLRNIDAFPWLRYETLKDFQKRFQDAVDQSERKEEGSFLVRKNFHSANVLDDDSDQPFTREFTDRLFDVLGSKQKLKNASDYKMDFQAFVKVRRMLFYVKSVASRQFLFDIVDLHGNGSIGIEEIRYFYNGLLRMHNQIDLAGEPPFAQFEEFFISWYDQITPLNDCRKKRLSFDHIKNHAYGDECLMMLLNYKSLMAFDRRFELGSDHDPAADTVVDENDENSNLMEEENKCREYLLDIFD